MSLTFPWANRRNPLVIPTGAKRNQVSVQSQAPTQDEFGGETANWNTVLTVMAAIATVSSKEMYQTGQTAQFTAQVTHMVTIDWPGASVPIAGGMQVVFGTRTFVVQTVENVQERNRVLNLMCLEINGVG
jgi:SPP1 family predicted phage head-tail adaptor